MEPRHPEITVRLSGEDGNALAILGRVQWALRRGRVPREEIDKFLEEAMSSDYDHLLQTVMKTVTVT